MTRARSLVVLAALGGALGVSLPVFARPWRVQEIPNGSVNTCYTCHIQVYPHGQWNAFGLDLKNNYGINGPGAPPVPWGKVYDVDSDGDGETNGQELGDPCGVWTKDSGCPPQFTTGISNPGLASSTTSTIPTCANAGKAPACNASGGDGGTSGSDGGTSAPPPATGCNAAPGPASLGAFLLIGLAGLAVRRRGPVRVRRR